MASYDRARERRLLKRYHEDGDVSAREQLVEQLIPLVHSVARRYADRGEPLDDLVQVGSIGLIKAIDRFDLERGVALSTFAVPTILGEIRRHFRDKGWSMRMPRDIQELSVRLKRTSEAFMGTHGRSPTVAELSAATEVSEERVLEALQAGHAYRAESLDRELDADGLTQLDLLPSADGGYRAAERRMLLLDGMRALEPRERKIVALRYFDDLTQVEISRRMGLSQMHVSRLLTRSLDEMRRRLTGARLAG